jgi:hypothetical protein
MKDPHPKRLIITEKFKSPASEVFEPKEVEEIEQDIVPGHDILCLPDLLEARRHHRHDVLEV